MSELLGKLTAELADKVGLIPDELISKINQNINPPETLTADNVHIRAMYIVSDQINSQGGCFPEDDYQNLTKLLIDSPVLIGHRKDTLPIARNFYAEKVVRDNINWVKAYFYWLKASDNDENLKNNIDAGIYKECSISFIFNFPECTICGADIRECRHRPFHQYDTPSGEKREAYFNYRGIEKVLETSLVYRGSVNDTSITKELSYFQPEEKTSNAKQALSRSSQFKRIWSLDNLSANQQYLVLPAYEALPVILTCKNGQNELRDINGITISCKGLDAPLSKLSIPNGEFAFDCRLIGYRGKERQRISELIKYLEGEKSSVSRVDLKIYDLLGTDESDTPINTSVQRRHILEELLGENSNLLTPVEIVSGNNLHSALRRLGTRRGIEIYSAIADERFIFTKCKSISAKIESKEESAGKAKYKLSILHGSQIIPLVNFVSSPIQLEVGMVVELSISSIFPSGNGLEALDPIVVDNFGSHSLPDESSSLCSIPTQKHQNARYRIYAGNNHDVHLVIEGVDPDEMAELKIRRLSLELLNTGRLFLCEPILPKSAVPSELIGAGTILGRTSSTANKEWELEGFLNGSFRLREAHLKGKKIHVIHRLGHGALGVGVS